MPDDWLCVDCQSLRRWAIRGGLIDELDVPEVMTDRVIRLVENLVARVESQRVTLESLGRKARND